MPNKAKLLSNAPSLGVAGRKRMEEALRGSEEKWRSLTGNTDDTIVVTDNDDVIRYINRTIPPTTPEGVIGKTVYEYVSEEHHNVMRESLKKVHETEKPDSYEITLDMSKINPELGILWFRTKVVPIISDKEVVGAIMIATNITERKQAVEALRESEERFRALTESTSDWIWEVDDKGVYTYASPRVKDLVGYEPEEVIGKTPFDLMPTEEAKRIAEEFRGIVESHRPFARLENINLHKDGRLVVLESSGVPFFDTDGRLCGYRGIDRDITERKQAEEAIKLAHAELNQIFNTAAGAMRVIDKDFNILRVNETHTALTGVSTDDAVGKKCYEVFPGSLCHTPQCPVTKILGGEKRVECEVDKERNDGTIVHCLLTATPFRGPNGNLVGIVEDFKDITERKRMEHDLRERVKELQCLYGIASIAERPELSLDELYQETANLLPVSWQYPEITCARITINDKEFKTEDYKETEWKQSSDIKVRGAKAGEVEVGYLEARPEIDEGPFLKEERLLIDAVAERLGRITERKQAEEQLRLQSKVIANMSEGVYIIRSSDGVIVYTNSKFEEIFGYDPGEMIGKHVSIVNAPAEKSPEETAEEIMEYINKTGEWRSEIQNIKKDGTPFWCYASVAVFDHPEYGKVWIVVHTDITERKQAEEELRIKDSAIASSINAIVMADLEGNFIYVNPSFLFMWGYDNENEVLGKPVVEFWQMEEQATEVMRTLLTEGAWQGELVGLRRVGTTFDVQLSASLVKDDNGNPLCMMASFVDITERKWMEAELQRTMAELARSNTELEQFAYVASHDLQEPLRMVSSYVQLLAQRYRDKLDSDADDFINYAVEGAERMRRLISDLLAYSRVGTRGKPFEVTDCQEVLDQAVTNLQVAIEESGAIVSHDALPKVMADSSQLVQLYQNLIGNAIKFHDEKPPQVHISAEQVDNGWVFSVHDNGIGIAPEYLERIFKIFQRLHSRAEYPGTGIGLAMCKKIVERHGGRIWVESEPGKGSQFYFAIPIRKEVRIHA